MTITIRPYAGLEVALEQHLTDYGEPEDINRLNAVQVYFVRGWEFSIGRNNNKERAWKDVLEDLNHVKAHYTRHAFDCGWKAARS